MSKAPLDKLADGCATVIAIIVVVAIVVGSVYIDYRYRKAIVREAIEEVQQKQTHE